MAWTSEELERIGKAMEVQLAMQQADGTLSPPTTIWAVRAGDEVYVRSVHGRAGKWWQRTQVRHAGHLSIPGELENNVTFEEADATLNDEIDVVYRAKYARYGQDILGTVLTPEARESTLRLVVPFSGVGRT